MGKTGNGIRFSNPGKSLLLTNLEIDNCDSGLIFESPFSYTQLMRVEMNNVTTGIEFASSKKATKLQLGESVFTDCNQALVLRSAALIVGMNCRFSGAKDQHCSDPNIVLDHAGISGVITGNDFSRGIACTSVDHLALSGNLFRNGFKSAVTNGKSHIITGSKSRIQRG